MPQKQSFVNALQKPCEDLAASLGLEFCSLALEKENTGSYLRIYLDKEDGLTLNDCERYHRAVQPMVEKYEYDFLEVCSPGIDRPVKTERDIKKALGATVEVRLYKPQDGIKIAQGKLIKMDDAEVQIELDGGMLLFPKKSVALVKLVPDLSALDENGIG